MEGFDPTAAAILGKVVKTPEQADVAVIRLPAPFSPRDDLALEAYFSQGTLEYRPGLVSQLQRIGEQVPLILVGVRDTSVPRHRSEPPHSEPPRPNETEEQRKKRLRGGLILQTFAMIGVGALLWPTAANWVSTLFHDGEISGYTSSVGAMTERERMASLDIASEYNQHLPAGMLRDPYTSPDDPEDAAAYQAYQEILAVQGTEVIGSLTYPSVGIGLPIFHGTSDKVLSEGIGHIFGSSLPVGGPGTHSALTSHSGQIHARLFDDLHKAKIGQTFHITVLGETTYYEVDKIIAVLPEEIEHLQIFPGEDYVTLITCTPIGVNSHRLLVRGNRGSPA